MKGIILIAALLTYVSTVSKAAESEEDLTKSSLTVDELNKNMTVLERWQNTEKLMKDFAKAAVKMILPILMDNSGKMKISKECMKNTMHLLSGLKNLKPWAVRFIDSSAKSIDGVLAESVSSLGAYDECLDTEVTSTRFRDKGKLLFRGQYCTIDMIPYLPPKPHFYKFSEVVDELKNFSQGGTVVAETSKLAQYFYVIHYQLGICTPSGCSKEDINEVAKLLGNAISLNASASHCEIKQENEYTPLIIAVITCYSFLGFLMLIGSSIDLNAYYRKTIVKHKIIRLLMAFSLFTNFRKFVDTKTSSDTLACLSGIRFLSISWIILGHTYFNYNFQLVRGLKKFESISKDFAFQAIVNGSVAVDTFFFIGGLLVCYLTIKLVRYRGRKFNVVRYIFHRIWRIMPVYVFSIMFMFLIPLMGSGPVWHDTLDRDIKWCYDNWWTNFIFINNFYNAEHMCNNQSWYLASDFQLYVGALLIILPLLRWPKLGIIVAVLGIISCVVYSGVGTYVNNFPPAMLLANPDMEQRKNYWAHFYFLPFVHAGPYCVGFLTGYLLAIKRDLKIPPFIQILGWCLAFIFNFSVLYGVFEWNKGVEPAFWPSILYASFNRTAWSMGLAWMVVCCVTGHGGVINYILSWKVFVPLSRLTYIAYLVHPVVQKSYMANLRTHLQLEHFMPVWIFFGHLTITYAVAFAGNMLIEAPFLTLEKILLFREDKKAENNSLGKENNILNRGLQYEKNNAIATMVSNTDEESGGTDNKCFVYKL